MPYKAKYVKIIDEIHHTHAGDMCRLMGLYDITKKKLEELGIEMPYLEYWEKSIKTTKESLKKISDEYEDLNKNR